MPTLLTFAAVSMTDRSFGEKGTFLKDQNLITLKDQKKIVALGKY